MTIQTGPLQCMLRLRYMTQHSGMGSRLDAHNTGRTAARYVRHPAFSSQPEEVPCRTLPSSLHIQMASFLEIRTRINISTEQMAAIILKLPPELLHSIAECCEGNHWIDYPGDEPLLQLRATCRAIEQATRREWLRKYFTYRYVMLDPVKLQQLRIVAQLPEFAAVITGLTVLSLDDRMHTMLEQHGSTTTRHIHTLRCASLMAMAFQCLRNLETVEFSWREENAAARIAGSDERWINFSATFANVMFAIQACGLQPTFVNATSLCFGLANRGGIGNLSMLPQLKNCFSGLRRLRLSVITDTLILDDNTDVERPGYYLIPALNSMTTLETLELELQCTVPGASAFAAIADNVYLPSLCDLTIARSGFGTRRLNQVLQRHSRSVKRVTVDNVRLTEAGNSDFRKLLEDMRDRLELHMLRMYSIRNRHGRIGFSGMEFMDWWEDEDEPEYTIVDQYGTVLLDDPKLMEMEITTLLDCMHIIKEY